MKKSKKKKIVIGVVAVIIIFIVFSVIKSTIFFKQNSIEYLEKYKETHNYEQTVQELNNLYAGKDQDEKQEVYNIVFKDEDNVNNREELGRKVLFDSIDIGKANGMQAGYNNINQKLKGDQPLIRTDTEVCAYVFKDFQKLIDRKNLKINNKGDGYADIKVTFTNKSLFDYSYIKYNIYFYDKNKKIIDTDWGNSDKPLERNSDIIIRTTVQIPKGTVECNVVPADLTSDQIDKILGV